MLEVVKDAFDRRRRLRSLRKEGMLIELAGAVSFYWQRCDASGAGGLKSPAWPGERVPGIGRIVRRSGQVFLVQTVRG